MTTPECLRCGEPAMLIEPNGVPHILCYTCMNTTTLNTILRPQDADDRSARALILRNLHNKINDKIACSCSVNPDECLEHGCM